MPVVITKHATEHSTARLTLRFVDDYGQDVEPKTLYWSLTDSAGHVINSRDHVTLTPALEVDLVLTGEDLPSTSNARWDSTVVYVLLEGTYDSDSGTDLPLVEEIQIPVDNVKFPLPRTT